MKENIVFSTLLAGNASDASLLDAWLDERGSERTLEQIPLPKEIVNARQDNARLLADAGDYDRAVAPGQIRILSKRFTADPDCIPYVAVLEEWDDDLWLVAPFSSYTYPATPGEMATRIRTLGLRVLQIWNARTVQTKLLEKSFLFGTLDGHVRQNAADLFRHEFSGKELPSTFDALTGPAVIYDADPRRDYLDECIGRLRPLSTAVKATARLIAEAQSRDSAGDAKGGVIPVDWDAVAASYRARPFWGEPEYKEALAAGNETNVTDTFVLGESELTVEYSPEEKRARLTIYDSKDRPDAAYDGYGVLGRDGEFLGVFREGAMNVPAELVEGGFQLVDSDGSAVDLKKKN